MKLDLPISQTSIIQRNANSLSIAAASIVAKVTRDELMKEYDQQFPGYDFATNAGYGTISTWKDSKSRSYPNSPRTTRTR